MTSRSALLEERLALAAQILGPRARRNVPIGPRTTYRVGGSAALYFEIGSDRDLEVVAGAVAGSGVEVLVLGSGSNLLVADAGFLGLVVVLGPSYSTLSLEIEPGLVAAGGSCAYPVLARRSAAAGLRGMEWAVGIPGSVGGGVRMNAGGHGAETADRLVEARVVDLGTGVERRLDAAALGLAYRSSRLSDRELVLEATFRCERGDAEASAREIDSIVRWRRENQPGGRNCGSVFANPPGDAAGRLVELAGLKGTRVGSAVVSTKHANFIQVDPGGSADDVLRLVDLVRATVAERCGVTLELELRTVGAPR